MLTTSKRRCGNLILGLVLSLGLVFGVIVSEGLCHEWTINGRSIEAKVVNFEGEKVVLEDRAGTQKSVPVNELNADDLQYLANLLAIRNAEIQQRLEQQQLQQQQTQFLSQYLDVWTVRMVAANGETGWRNYLAANSLHAKQLAWSEFPNTRIVGVQRVRRSGGVNGLIGNGNLGINPIIPQLPVTQFLLLRN
ncbi:MAG: hypothetical protein AAF939_12405 [Planctomycetota bacterium]